ncbi:MAG: AMP-binding protein [Anaerolineales bacterium]|nr:AMP-binding protein [Anaerolineales bacterium]
MRQNDIVDFNELMRRSTKDVAWYTDALFKYLNIEFYEPYTQVVDLSKGIQWPQWCIGGKMNIAHNCLDKYIGTPTASKTAYIWEGEEGQTRSITYAELHRLTNQAANALRSLGLGKGDAIGIYMPMTPEIIASVLAIAKIGAIIVPLFSGYGVSAVVTRLNETGAKALFCADGFYRRGKLVLTKPVADEAAKQVPSLKHMIVLNRADQDVDMTEGRDHWWHEIMPQQAGEARTEVTRAEATLMVIYTSGTTGKPKGAVHTHGGFPIKATQDVAFGMDFHSDEIIYWITDMGWMLGPWMVFGPLLMGGTGFLYDGALDYPGPDRLWAMIECHQINKLGLSPTLIRALMAHGEEPVRKHDLSSLRMVGSTGEPWNHKPWMWLFEVVGKGEMPIINYTGGTELAGGILMGNPLLPIKPTSFPGPCPGVAADVLDEEGKSVVNQVGELVIKTPWIGMTRGFWKDPERYLQTYWSRWPDTWVHGDWAAVDSDGQWYVLGRSDDTIKVAGKRLGPAEVESILVDHPEVVEAAAIGVPHEIKGSEIVAFCVSRPETKATDDLRGELRQMVARAMGKPLAPREILFVSALPMTRNAKVMRRVIRSVYLGQDPGDTSSLVNPEAVEEIKKAR